MDFFSGGSWIFHGFFPWIRLFPSRKSDANLGPKTSPQKQSKSGGERAQVGVPLGADRDPPQSTRVGFSLLNTTLWDIVGKLTWASSWTSKNTNLGYFATPTKAQLGPPLTIRTPPKHIQAKSMTPEKKIMNPLGQNPCTPENGFMARTGGRKSTPLASPIWAPKKPGAQGPTAGQLPPCIFGAHSESRCLEGTHEASTPVPCVQITPRVAEGQNPRAAQYFFP